MNTDKIYAEKIASDYIVKETSKIVRLKKLDRKAKQGANIFAYTFGVIMALVLGVGMCLAMGQIGNGQPIDMVLGIIIGLAGIAGVSVNYPIYKILLKNGKKKYGNDIIMLAKEVEATKRRVNGNWIFRYFEFCTITGR